MKKIILFLTLFIILFTIGCKPTLNCEQVCKDAGYLQGECKEVPVIEDPCSKYEETTLFDFECEQKPPENIVGIGYMCCCK